MRQRHQFSDFDKLNMFTYLSVSEIQTLTNKSYPSIIANQFKGDIIPLQLLRKVPIEDQIFAAKAYLSGNAAQYALQNNRTPKLIHQRLWLMKQAVKSKFFTFEQYIKFASSVEATTKRNMLLSKMNLSSNLSSVTQLPDAQNLPAVQNQPLNFTENTETISARFQKSQNKKAIEAILNLKELSTDDKISLLDKLL